MGGELGGPGASLPGLCHNVQGGPGGLPPRLSHGVQWGSRGQSPQFTSARRTRGVRGA